MKSNKIIRTDINPSAGIEGGMHKYEKNTRREDAQTPVYITHF